MDQDLTIFIAPWGIIIGGGLIAISGLTLFGHPLILQTKTQAILALFAGIVILGAVELRFVASSAAFLEAQKVVVSDCHLEAEAENPSKHGTQSDEINKSIAACLSQAGYEWNPEHRRCQEAPLAMNAYCYRPTGFFSRLITNMQLYFE
jgi:hypothetical protein